MDNFIKLAMVIAAIYLGLRVMGIDPLAGSDEGKALAGLMKEADIHDRNKIVVLLTGTAWCPYCRDLDRDVISNPEWQKYIKRNAIFASYEYGATERPTSGAKGEMLRRFDIEGFPTMIVLNSDGKVLGKQSGYGHGGVSRYKEWIESL